MEDPKRILLDLQDELSGELLSEIVEVRGRKFEMRLLNDAEHGWVYGLVNFRSDLKLALEARRSTLAAGIRSIDGVSLEDMYLSDWEALDEKEQKEMIADHGSLAFCFANFFLEGFLKKVPSSFINDLHMKWQELESRRVEAQGELKNSSGEDSEKEEKKNLTESSQDGES